MTRSELVIVGKIMALELIIILPFYLISHFYNRRLEQSKHQRIAAYQEIGRNMLQTENFTNKKIPLRLRIPRINVNATIESVGVTPSGAMDIPSSTTSVGWFSLGPLPGEKGSAVIDGHFDAENNENGVFLDLSELRKGDSIFVDDTSGTTTSFIVRESHTYEPGYLESVFTKDDGRYLNLITCDGIWDSHTHSFSKRLIVFADAI